MIVRKKIKKIHASKKDIARGTVYIGVGVRVVACARRYDVPSAASVNNVFRWLLVGTTHPSQYFIAGGYLFLLLKYIGFFLKSFRFLYTGGVGFFFVDGCHHRRNGVVHLFASFARSTTTRI